MLRNLSQLLIVTVLTLLSTSELFAFTNKSQSPPAVQIAVDDLPVFFSPYAPFPLDLQYAHLFFDPLLRWGKDRQLEKRLLQKWDEQKSGITRFYLKKGIQFHSGNQLSSDDIVWTFAQIVNSSHSRHFFEGIKQIKRVNRYSFDLYSDLSQAQILDYLTHFFVLDAQFYRRNKIDMNKAQSEIRVQHPQLSISGTGPYYIKKYNRALSLDVVRNQNYWQGQAAINELRFIKIRSADSRSFALLANDIDICESVSKQMFDTVQFNATKSLIEVNSAEVFFLTLNDKKTAIFKDDERRAAISFVINKAEMLKQVIKSGSTTSGYTPLTQKKQFHSQLPFYDVAKAKYLLGKEKIPQELSLLVFTDPRDNTSEVAKAFVSMMKRIGVKLRISEVDNITVWNKTFFDYDFTLSVWHSPLIVSDHIYPDLFAGSPLANYINALFAQAKLENPMQSQTVLFEQMQREHRIIPLFIQNKIWAADKNYNLDAIFSVDGIPYWQLLRENNSAK